MNKTILTTIIMTVLFAPAMGAVDIPATGNSTCDSSTLNASSGNVSLEADWSANNISITWDGNGGSTPSGGAATCTYDSTFTLPTKPTRNGYTFAGWAVKNCFSDIWDYVFEYSEYDNYVKNWSVTGYEPVNLRRVQITGTSLCSVVDRSDIYETKTNAPEEYTGNDEGLLTTCWCKATSLNIYDDGANPNTGDYCSAGNSNWVSAGGGGNINECLGSCSEACARTINDNKDTQFMALLFGVEERSGNCDDYSDDETSCIDAGCNWAGDYCTSDPM